jgi:hypothetical protein
MSRFLILLICVAATAAGCGGEEAREAQPTNAESSADAAARGDAQLSAATPISSNPRARVSLTPAERRQLRAIATSIDNVVDEFDSAVRECTKASCIEAAFALVVADLDWPPYYLQRIGARRRDCEPMTAAATGIYGFNLGVRQLDSAVMAEDGTRQRDVLALVDGLRHVPYDLRSAAASGCR